MVYGGLLVAALSKLVGMELPGAGWIWQSLAIQFKNPLYVGQKAEITAAVTYANADLGIYQLKVDIQSEGRVIAQGQIQAGKLRDA